MKKLLALLTLVFSHSLFAASYPANTDCGSAGDFLYKLGADRGRTANLTMLGPVLLNLPESASTEPTGVILNQNDSAWEFDTNLCNPVQLIENYVGLGMPIGAHGTFLRYFDGLGSVAFGGPQDRGFRFDAAGATSQDQVVEVNPWPGDSLAVDNYAGMTSIECAWSTYWNYGTPTNTNLIPSGTRCGSLYTNWDHLSLTGVMGFSKMSGELLLHMSDQSSTGMAIYDLSDPLQPRLLSDYNAPVSQPGAPDIGVGGYWVDTWGERYAIFSAEPIEVADGNVPQRIESTISIIDFLDPENPQLACYITFDFGTRTDIGSRPMYVAVQDHYVWVDQFRVDIPECITRFNYDNSTQAITDPIDDTDYAAVVFEIPDFLYAGDCSQYARPIGQVVLCGGIINAGSQIVTLDDTTGLTTRQVGTNTSEGGDTIFMHYVRHDNPNDILIESFSQTLVEVGDVINIAGLDRNVTAAVVDERVNTQGIAAFVQFDEPDTNPPYVAGSRPLDGQTNFPVHSQVHFHIPETLRSDSIDAAILNGDISVTRPGTPDPIQVTFDIKYSHTGNFALDFTKLVDTTYTVNIAGIQDFMGNTMAPHSFSFTTGNAPVTRGQNVFDALGGQTEAPSFSGTAYYPNQSGELECQPDIANGDVWVVNPDNDTVTIISQSVGSAPDFALTTGVVREIAGGTEENPSSVTKIGSEFAVTWRDTDKVIMYDAAGDSVYEYTMPHGSQPVSAIADGNTLYVALYSDESILKIDNSTRSVVDSAQLNARFIGLSGNELISATPKAMALSADGSRLLVARRVSSKDKGLIYDIATSDMTLTRTIDVNKVLVSDALDHGSGVLNNLNSLVISPDGTRLIGTAFKQNIDRGTGAGSTGQALDDDNTIRAALFEIDLVTNTDINTDPSTFAGTIDLDNSADPIAVTFTPDGNSRLTALRGNNRVLVNEVSGLNVTTEFTTGFAPSDFCTTLRTVFVKNFTDRTVSAIDIAGWMFDQRINPPIQTINTVATEALSASELAGLKSFYHSTIPAMGPEGYMTCASCHFDSADDGMVWDMTQNGEGPRNTLSLNGKSGTRFGNLHWTQNFDEVQDFECQIEQLNSGEGLVPGFSTCASGTDPLTLTTTGLSTELDNLADYVNGLGKSEVSRSSDRNTDGTNKQSALAGATVFANSGCAVCHAGAATTDSLMHDVGTGGTFETPVLIDLEDTPPYYHDGSAIDLKTVFTIGQHATDTAGLNELEKGNLIAYILSLERDDFVDDVAQGPDTTPPVITIVGYSAGDTINLTVGDSFTPPAATALDDVDGSVTVVVDASGVDTATAGNYFLGYTATDAATNETLALLNIVVGNPPVSATSQRIFAHHHSLWQHNLHQTYTIGGRETSTDWWIGEFANEAGITFENNGQFGQLEAQTLPVTLGGTGTSNTPDSFPEGTGDTYGQRDFTSVVIMPANFQWLTETVNTHRDWALAVVDYIQTEEPGVPILIYEHTPEVLNTFPLSAQQMTDYWTQTSGAYHTFYLDYYNALVAARPAANFRLIPAGAVIADMLNGVAQSGIDTTALAPLNSSAVLWEDEAPHGNPAKYFLYGVVMYHALYQQDLPATYVPPSAVVTQTITDNITTINDYVRERLNYYNANGVNVYGTN